MVVGKGFQKGKLSISFPFAVFSIFLAAERWCPCGMSKKTQRYKLYPPYVLFLRCVATSRVCTNHNITTKLIFWIIDDNRLNNFSTCRPTTFSAYPSCLIQNGKCKQETNSDINPYRDLRYVLSHAIYQRCDMFLTAHEKQRISSNEEIRCLLY